MSYSKIERRVITTIVSTLCLLLLPPVLNITTASAYAAAGDLDVTFNPQGAIPGIQTTTPVGRNDGVSATAIDTAGRLVVGGWSSNEGNTSVFFTLGRYTTTGILDQTFGIGGFETTTIPGITWAYLVALKIDSLGRILITGLTDSTPGENGLTGGYSQIVVARYTDDGSLDPSFGNGGVAINTIAGTSFVYIKSMVIDGADNIVIAGQININDVPVAIVGSYTSAVVLDSTFGNGGFETTTVGVRNYINTIAIDSTGRIVAGGISFDSENRSFLTLFRYSDSGVLDSTFGSNGIETTSVEGYTESQIISIGIDITGKIVAAAAASAANGQYYFILGRYTSAGVLDSTFGNEGIESITAGVGIWPSSIIIDDSNRIIAGGYNWDIQDNYSPILMRFTSSGLLDPTFGNAGIVTGKYDPAATTWDDEVLSVSIDNLGNILTGGYRRIGPNQNTFVVARYLSGDAASSNNNNNSGSNEATIAAARAQAEAAAAKKLADAVSLLNSTITSGGVVTSQMLSNAGILGVTERNLAFINADLKSLPAGTTKNFALVVQLADKYATVDQVASGKKFYFTDLARVGLVTAHDPNAAAIMRALKTLSADQIDTPAEITAAVASVKKKIADKKAVLKARLAKSKA